MLCIIRGDNCVCQAKVTTAAAGGNKALLSLRNCLSDSLTGSLLSAVAIAINREVKNELEIIIKPV